MVSEGIEHSWDITSLYLRTRKIRNLIPDDASVQHPDTRVGTNKCVRWERGVNQPLHQPRMMLHIPHNANIASPP